MKTVLSDLSHDSTESDRYDYLLALLIFDTHSGCRQWYGCCLATSHVDTEFPEPRIKHKIFMVCVLKKGATVCGTGIRPPRPGLRPAAANPKAPAQLPQEM
jgi:hypothetical protein